jgi:hypothetical protein
MASPRLWTLPLLLFVLMAVACSGADTITCDTNDGCLQGGIPGICLASPRSDAHFCAFSDPTCPAPTSARWGVKSGDGLATICVGEAADGGAAPADGGVPDAAPPASFFRRLGGAGRETVGSVALTDDGSVYVVGDFTGTTELGTGPLASAGGVDGYVVKLSPLGAVEWAHRFGDTGTESNIRGAVDGQGGLVLGGRFTGVIDFGCGPKNGGASGSSFLVKYSEAGMCVWSRTFSDGFADVAVDAQGDAYVVGSFSGSGLFGGDQLTSQGSTDIFLARFASSTGVGVWSERWGGSKSDDAVAVTVRGAQVAIAADTLGDSNFGGTLLSNEFGAMALAKYATATGAHVWSRQVGGNPDGGFLTPVHVLDIAMDPSGQVLACGNFEGPIDLGAGTVQPAGITDAWMAAYASTTGAHVWSQVFGGGGDKQANVVTVLPDLRVAVGGWFTGDLSIGGLSLVSSGARDAFLLTFEASGLADSARSWSSTGDDQVSVIASADPLVFAGTFAASVDFGDFGGVATSSGSLDVFVIRHALP